MWMIVSGLCFVAVAVTVRWVGPGIPAAQASFIRYLFGTLLMAPSLVAILLAPGSFGSLRLLSLRSVVHVVGVLLWFYAMARIPMQQVTALGYITPILVTVGAALFLGERLQMRRIVAVIIGFIGVLIILRPGFQSVSSGQIALLVCSPLFAISFLLAKKLTQSHQSTTIIAIFCVLGNTCNDAVGRCEAKPVGDAFSNSGVCNAWALCNDGGFSLRTNCSTSAFFFFTTRLGHRTGCCVVSGQDRRLCDCWWYRTGVVCQLRSTPRGCARG